MPAALGRFLIMGFHLVRQLGAPGFIGLAAGVVALFATGSEWAGLGFGIAAGLVSAALLTSRTPA